MLVLYIKIATPVENPSAKVGHLLQEALADHPSSCFAVGFVPLRGSVVLFLEHQHPSLMTPWVGQLDHILHGVATNTCLVFSGMAQEEHQVCLTVLFSFSGFLLQSAAVAEGPGGGVPLWRSRGDAGRQQDRPGRGAGGDLGGGPGDCPYVSAGAMGGAPNTPDHLLTQPRVPHNAQFSFLSGPRLRVSLGKVRPRDGGSQLQGEP